jgi:2-amino-4-hydroxy-6-hydroxymethyldihydropteridine diphosphokinase
VSSFYTTEPVGYRAQRRFWNAVAEIRWHGSPRALLRAIKEIERRRGRIPTFPGGPRRIDLDILDLGGLVADGPAPILPHPRLAERRFVLAPLAEIAPTWRHPVQHRTAARLLAGLPKKPEVRRIPGSSYKRPDPEMNRTKVRVTSRSSSGRGSASLRPGSPAPR